MYGVKDVCRLSGNCKVGEWEGKVLRKHEEAEQFHH
jgi:hypothetical protein